MENHQSSGHEWNGRYISRLYSITKPNYFQSFSILKEKISNKYFSDLVYPHNSEHNL